MPDSGTLQPSSQELWIAVEGKGDGDVDGLSWAGFESRRPRRVQSTRPGPGPHLARRMRSLVRMGIMQPPSGFRLRVYTRIPERVAPESAGLAGKDCQLITATTVPRRTVRRRARRAAVRLDRAYRVDQFICRAVQRVPRSHCLGYAEELGSKYPSSVWTSKALPWLG